MAHCVLSYVDYLIVIKTEVGERLGMIEEVQVGNLGDFILRDVDFVECLELLQLLTELLTRHPLITIDQSSLQEGSDLGAARYLET